MRGNVLDLAVGVIVGGAFTGIVNALSDHILKPIINWLLALILGENSLEGIYTYLKRVETDGAVDLAKSIYIDWGAFINAIINFLLIAFVLFCIVKTINKFAEAHDKMVGDLDLPKKKKIAEYKKSGMTKKKRLHATKRIWRKRRSRNALPTNRRRKRRRKPLPRRKEKPRKIPDFSPRSFL